MAESIESLLAGRNIAEPSEIAIIKSFVEQKFQLVPDVAINEKQIIIIVQGAALAGALRPFLLQIQEECKTTKRLVIRIK